MKYYLKPNGENGILFAVLDSNSQPVYEVTGEYSSIGCRYSLRSCGGGEAARITGVIFPRSVQYAVSAGKRRLHVSLHIFSKNQSVTFKGVRWSFRGDLLNRSFDILDSGSSQVVMSHGRCWDSAESCYGLEIQSEKDELLALCVAVIIDSGVPGMKRLAIPAG